MIGKSLISIWIHNSNGWNMFKKCPSYHGFKEKNMFGRIQEKKVVGIATPYFLSLGNSAQHQILLVLLIQSTLSPCTCVMRLSVSKWKVKMDTPSESSLPTIIFQGRAANFQVLSETMNGLYHTHQSPTSGPAKPSHLPNRTAELFQKIETLDVSSYC